MGRGKKRKADEAVIATSIQQIAALANAGNISASQIKKARIGLPSFSAAKWTEVAPQFGLSDDLGSVRLDPYLITPVLLPPSFHETVAEAAWRIQDVYQERISQEREEVRVRSFDAYLIPIVGLFQGRVIDKPEHPMVSTDYSSGGEVEHELFMIGGIIFFVIELMLGYEGQDNVAQLFLELLSAAEMNKKANFEGLRVHGLLTDLQAFHFYSYDPTRRKFAFDETLQASGAREVFIADMIRVTNKVFTVILSAYVEGLAASVKASRERPPGSPTGSSPVHRLLSNGTGNNTNSGSRKSTEQWELAHVLAMQCLKKFKEPVRTIEDVENQSCEAIRLLTKSVRFIPRFSYYSGKADPSTESELREVACRIVRTEYMTMIGASEQHGG
ncbi:hypothetical protein AX15_005598 [Amanita polypyramis BW_CC]|nr:hypothetical protein AX15_005598 [Amanita polypyramis BW_CC]